MSCQKFLTREADLKHHSLLPVFDGADGGELVVEQKEEGAGQKAHETHEHAVVTGVCILIEDTVEPLAAHVDVALIYDGGEDHQGKYLTMRGWGTVGGKTLSLTLAGKGRGKMDTCDSGNQKE